MANRNYASGGKIYSMHVKPVLLDCNFVVDSTNGNGLGIRSLKGPMIQSVTMQSAIPAGGSPSFGTARTYAVLGASAVTNTGNTVLTGNLGIFPGTSITGFPPGTFSGVENIANAAAAQAQASALSTYNTLVAHSSTIIPSALDGQTLTAGYYSFTSGAATLATAGNGTLTLSGSATDLFVIKTATTLTTGAGGTPTITLTGGALASNVYWVIGSSATINSGFTGVFNGNIIANTSITDTLGGTVNGSLVALNGAVTLSAATTGNAQPLSFSGPEAGTILVQFNDNFNRSLSGFSAFVSPVSGTSVKIDNSALSKGKAYIITTLGNSTAAAWHTLGVPAGVTPATGVSFIAASVGAGANTSTSRVMAPAANGTGIDHIETVGDPTLSMNPNPTVNQGFGGQIILNCYANGVQTAPSDGSVISLAFYLSDSSILLQGE